MLTRYWICRVRFFLSVPFLRSVSIPLVQILTWWCFHKARHYFLSVPFLRSVFVKSLGLKGFRTIFPLWNAFWHFSLLVCSFFERSRSWFHDKHDKTHMLCHRTEIMKSYVAKYQLQIWTWSFTALLNLQAETFTVPFSLTNFKLTKSTLLLRDQQK